PTDCAGRGRGHGRLAHVPLRAVARLTLNPGCPARRCTSRFPPARLCTGPPAGTHAGRRSWPAWERSTAASTGAGTNLSRQMTVYTASDPLVALTERAFCEALTWQDTLATTLLPNLRQPPVRPPLVATFRLWDFRLNLATTGI